MSDKEARDILAKYNLDPKEMIDNWLESEQQERDAIRLSDRFMEVVDALAGELEPLVADAVRLAFVQTVQEASLVQPARDAAPVQFKDAVFQASIDFIAELTGMRPPDIEVAPPEVFTPFREFTEKIVDLHRAAAPQPAAMDTVCCESPNPNRPHECCMEPIQVPAQLQSEEMCPHCDDTMPKGRDQCEECDKFDATQPVGKELCSLCGGTGSMGTGIVESPSYICPHCDGTGYEPQQSGQQGTQGGGE